uniref:Uncharacterized protein n=1 Tax=Picea sitchensis TaxID=3332 RepID=D5ACM8_PICSI|nr:unknown [Picea sitchensis]
MEDRRLEAHIADRPEFDPPGQVWDFLVTGIIGFACIPFISGNVVLLCNRKYRPIKSKNVNLTVLSSLGGLIWVGSTIVVNGHWRRDRNSIWASCSLWTFWLQTCFGFCLWLNCMNVHLLVLYYIFILKKAAGGMKSNMIRLAGLLLPIIVFCICASAKHVSRIIRNGGVICVFQFLLYLVTTQTQAKDQVVGRSFLSLSISSAVFYYFWARNGGVIYNVIFHKEEYAQKFIADLQRCPSERDSREIFPSSFRDLETELKEAREVINRYHNQIEQLEEEVCTMEQKVSDLQQQVELNCSQAIKESEMSKYLN